jgi:hypothetical protein
MTPAAAENSAVISVSFFSSTNFELRDASPLQGQTLTIQQK